MKKISIKIIIFIIVIGTVVSCEKEEDNLNISDLVAVWELDKFIDKNNNTLNAPEIQISFLENKCITLFTSYNYGQGEFSINGKNVIVSNLVLSDREYDLENDNRFISNLTGSYLINGDTLRILSDHDYDMVLHKTQIVDPYQCDLSILLIDTIDSNRYYQEDIFGEEYSSIYGKWFVYSVYGGWGGWEKTTGFDFFEFNKNGIYGISKGFDLWTYGKIQMKKLTANKLLLDFIPDNNSKTGWLLESKRLTFPVNDTIILYDDCLECNRYYLSRVN